jgi:hypothetical protein
VPRTSPPSIRIKDQQYTWREGEGVLFDDTWPHEIRNDCQDMRAVLIVDIPRPMTGIAALVSRVMVLLGRLTYAQVVSSKAQSFSRAIAGHNRFMFREYRGVGSEYRGAAPDRTAFHATESPRLALRNGRGGA